MQIADTGGRRYVPRHCSLGFDVMYHSTGGAGHGGLLVADGKRPVTVYEEKVYK